MDQHRPASRAAVSAEPEDGDGERLTALDIDGDDGMTGADQDETASWSSDHTLSEQGSPLAAADLEQAFLSHERELIGTVYHLVGNAEDARDVVQDTFVKCWRRRGELTDIRHLKAWIFQVAVNAGKDFLRSAWQRRKETLEAEGNALATPQAGPDVSLDLAEQRNRLSHAIRQLRPEEQEVFLLRQNADMTFEEIAESLHLPLGTVKTRMRKALMELRAAFADDEG